MTQFQADLIAQSLDAVVARAGDPAAAIFERLFAEIPDARERFARDVSGAVRGEMLAMVFDCLMDPGGPYQANIVRTERTNHDGFGTPPAEFDRFFWIVRDACRDLAGPDWTSEMDAAWTAGIARIVGAST